MKSLLVTPSKTNMFNLWAVKKFSEVLAESGMPPGWFDLMFGRGDHHRGREYRIIDKTRLYWPPMRKRTTLRLVQSVVRDDTGLNDDLIELGAVVGPWWNATAIGNRLGNDEAAA